VAWLHRIATFRKLSALAASRGILLFSDEVYRESEHDIKDRLPAACDLNSEAISLGVISKSYGLAGLRIGWVATKNQKILKRMAELKDYTTICNSAPSEFLAELGLRHRKVLLLRNLQIIESNLKLLDRFFEKNRSFIKWVRPRAGTLAFPELLVGGSATTFCEKIVKERGVMLLPGEVFGAYSAHFRIGFGRKNMPEALEQLDSFLNNNA
jgi:aspartate/methionine/tyrosine aminotransferase